MPRRRDDDDESEADVYTSDGEGSGSSSEGSGSEEFSDEASGSGSGSGSEDESSSGEEEDSDDEEKAFTNNNQKHEEVDTTGFSSDLYETSGSNAHWRTAGKAYNETLGFGGGNIDDVSTSKNSHSFPHDQLPSAEEVKHHRATQQGLGSARQRLRHRKLFDPTVMIIVGTIALMAGVFVFMFLWFPTMYYGDDDDNNNSNSNQTPTPPPSAAPTRAPGDPALLKDRIRTEIALEGGLEFANPASYQSKALEFLIERVDSFQHHENDRLGQAYALLCLYYLTNDNNSGGQSWRDTLIWLSGDNICTWSGVTCNFSGLVQKLDLTNGNLVASTPTPLPAELQLLQGALETLILDDNPGLQGPIPSVLGSLDKLILLSLENCEFTGDVPNEVCDLVTQTPNFALEVDCSKVLCQQTCCDGCY